MLQRLNTRERLLNYLDLSDTLMIRIKTLALLASLRAQILESL